MIDTKNLSAWERDFVAEIKARIIAKQPVSMAEKQVILNLARRTGAGMSTAAAENAKAQGFDVSGIKIG